VRSRLPEPQAQNCKLSAENCKFADADRAALSRFPTHFGKEQGAVMKSSLFSKIILASLALVLAGSAFAVNAAHKQTFQILAPTQVNGTQIPAGEYQAQWEGSGPNVQVSIKQGKKVIATVPAQVVELGQVSREDAAEIKSNASGERELTSLRFSGKTYSLALGSESASAQTKSDSSN
jgi:hypothetical protein